MPIPGKDAVLQGHNKCHSFNKAVLKGERSIPIIEAIREYGHELMKESGLQE